MNWGAQVVDETGRELALADLCKDHGIVLFFYPKANTPGASK